MNILDEFNYEWFIDEIEDGGVLKFKEGDISVVVCSKDEKIVVRKYTINDIEKVENGEPFMNIISEEEMDAYDIRLMALYKDVLNKKYILKRANRYC